MTDVPPEAQPNDFFDYEHNPTWRIFRIMSEFVDGFTFLARVQRSVTFFGSARLPTTHPYYQLARENAALADAYSAYIDHLMAKY